MLRLFHSVTKGRPCGVHQCSCSNQVLLCTPLRQGAWKEGQEGLPHLRKEERAEWHVTPGCSGQNEAGSGFAPCTLHKWGRHPHRLKAGHSHPATRFQFPQLRGQVCMHGLQRVIGTVRAAPDGILWGLPGEAGPSTRACVELEWREYYAAWTPGSIHVALKILARWGVVNSTNLQVHRHSSNTLGAQCVLVSTRFQLERRANAHTVCYITWYQAAHHNFLSVFL